MNKFALIVLAAMLTLGCTGSLTEVDPDVGVLPEIVDTTVTVNGDRIHVCDHKFTEQRDFNYVGQITSYTQTLFGESVTTFEFTLLDGNLHYLSADELANYRCE